MTNSVEIKQHIKYLAQSLFRTKTSKVIVWTHRHTYAVDWLLYLATKSGH